MKVAVLVAASFALSVAGSTPAPEELRFTPSKGLVLERTFEAVTERMVETSYESLSATQTSLSEQTLVVTDRVQAVEDGRVTKLSRNFQEISCKFESSEDADGSTLDTSMSGSSDVEGATVVFEWDEDEESYITTSDEVADEVLTELAFDYDLTSLLPESEVAEEDVWSVDTDAFLVLTDPCKGLPWVWEWESEGVSSKQRSDDEDGPELELEVDGEILATFSGTHTTEGVRVGIISIEGEIEIKRTSDSTTAFDSGPTASHMERSQFLTVEGEALWDLEAGRLHSLVIEMSWSETGTIHSAYWAGDREFEQESNHEGEGTATFTVSIAVVE